ncbi:MAG: Holliday junction DNA helicase RuvA [Candidatus Taylorbacteria bacterium RIFCSPHIGHO2_01_FULL_45_63]|uniref:Holliday junction branch migration complex subunit RuvA n=1 Tax=Candidatus Taylorbacteria bacterium RIFCSPHIGHO2_02_FULL_45_35 TaxID=1802311 RepID=A0A1G2MS29_9BACT|nr:MAG: Holliday junction DNA helicase RuvA [Candidatus Taylorbacteria bacterium RIFCSPHIGHO2_01_FULL_45_63]OHA26673.1 MAG: Holliday junction DNA helicase RuvA [Candidatus Taylorbacteria bacterium RIFCSPHIGHO2_02_FULL_45_35]OHA32586.1 MAG: Holliday junction DNA helicase RuvA [Candidatus Taylorbacteria bacterium RIFCSPLOWO2_01_FULL_45_34b]
MISHLKGAIIQTFDSYTILDVAGVGYKVFVTGETLGKLKNGSEVSLWTHLVVKDDALDLYGFLDRENHDFFILLLTVSGVGPKSALAILNLVAVSTLRKAISKGDPSYLSKISGIGTKKAEKIVLELKDRLHLSKEEMKGELQDDADSIGALEALGYSGKEARDALKKIAPEISKTSDRIKAALKILGK